MEKNLDYKSARDLLLNIIIPVDSIEVPLEKCADGFLFVIFGGRVNITVFSLPVT